MASSAERQQRVQAAAYRVFERVRQGESFSAAAKAEHIDKRTVRRFNEAHGILEKQTSGRYAARSDLPIMRVLQPSGQSDLLEVDRQYASVLSRYWHEVDRLTHGKSVDFSQFASVTVYDTSGKRYQLMTDENAILAWWNSLPERTRNRITEFIYPNKRGGQLAA